MTVRNLTDFLCPKSDGIFPDPNQCDKFWECVDGEAESQLCPDGLVYDPTNRNVNKCDHRFQVDCSDRPELQPAQPTEACPRRNGIFAHPESSVCHLFYTCVDGAAVQTECAAGLVFDENTGTCTWPESAGRQGCFKKAGRLPDGFECPTEEVKDVRGLTEIHPKYPHEDCAKFYVCLNRIEPRLLTCDRFKVFNVEKSFCDDPENVPDCEDYFGDVPVFQKPATKVREE
ncbi:hypothetical protein QYM36_005219 [Artemia franciscana]|uniref:Chitin-binding type-2 domain-containing protein n=1 Tax=Artemia franciscana TaxID=6661 RepID=A0AA88I4H6_ARTSF|nr:hypothetical protein QYM36_005219 [Artemia franciscana]